MDDKTQKKDRRFKCRGWLLALAALVLLVGATRLYVAVRRGAIERRLETLRAAGHPTSFAELAQYHRPPQGAANAADTYLRAFAAFVPPPDWTVLPFWTPSGLARRGEPLAEEMVKAISECQAANEGCLALLHEAAGIEHCRYDWDYSKLWPHLNTIGNCARLLQDKALLCVHRGRIEEAVVCVEDGLRLGESLRRQPLAVNTLAGDHYCTIALRSLERILSRVALGERQLGELSAGLAAVADSPSLVDTMITERGLLIGNCERFFAARSLRLGSAMYWLPGAKERALADILDYTEACVEASRLPPVEGLKRFRQISDGMSRFSFLRGMTQTGVPVTRVVELDLHARAHLELGRTALAIERYRVACGKLPERLEELVPQYLQEVPRDPFDGNPLRYRRTEPGYCLYSVSEDGQDDGGKEETDVPSGAPYDWCFIVTR